MHCFSIIVAKEDLIFIIADMAKDRMQHIDGRSAGIRRLAATWLKKGLEDIKAASERVPLSFEIVATRDIEVGEEMCLDYGEKWEEAWIST
jgi:hypothetical protein